MFICDFRPSAFPEAQELEQLESFKAQLDEAVVGCWAALVMPTVRMWDGIFGAYLQLFC